MQNPLLAVRQLGQSIWYDNIRRSLITSGDLRAMVKDDGLCGVTSNPAIFEKALNGSADYEQPLRALVEAGAPSALEIYERLAVQDIQMAADVLAAAYRDTDGVDGSSAWRSRRIWRTTRRRRSTRRAGCSPKWRGPT